jgi:hypothetical protein
MRREIITAVTLCKEMDRTRVFRQAEELQFTCEMNGRTHNMRVRPGINDVKNGYNS